MAFKGDGTWRSGVVHHVVGHFAGQRAFCDLRWVVAFERFDNDVAHLNGVNEPCVFCLRECWQQKQKGGDDGVLCVFHGRVCACNTEQLLLQVGVAVVIVAVVFGRVVPQRTMGALLIPLQPGHGPYNVGEVFGMGDML